MQAGRALYWRGGVAKKAPVFQEGTRRKLFGGQDPWNGRMPRPVQFARSGLRYTTGNPRRRAVEPGRVELARDLRPRRLGGIRDRGH